MTIGILVAPTEPTLLKQLGRSSSVPEKHGVDVLVPSLHLGVQRKQVNDLVASMSGDRLAKEMLQMKQLAVKALVIEGKFHWNADGEWMNGFQRFTLKQYRGLLYSVQRLGVMVVETRDLRDTCREIGHLIRWVSKTEHRSLETRPKHLISKWGTRDDADFQMWLLQGLDGIGPKQAREIVKWYGRVPMLWDTTVDELMKVPGIGKGRAEKMLRALGQGVNGQV